MILILLILLSIFSFSPCFDFSNFVSQFSVFFVTNQAKVFHLHVLTKIQLLYHGFENKAPGFYAFHITKTCLYNFDPLKPQFYIVKPGFTGVYIIFLIYA